MIKEDVPFTSVLPRPFSIMVMWCYLKGFSYRLCNRCDAIIYRKKIDGNSKFPIQKDAIWNLYEEHWFYTFQWIYAADLSLEPQSLN